MLRSDIRSLRQNDGVTYALRAGFGIHIPSTAPHGAQNGDDVSAALSLNYDLRSVQQNGRIHALNRRLRRLGMDPRLPGVSAWRDRVKLTTATTIRTMRHLAGGARATPHPLGWKPPAPYP